MNNKYTQLLKQAQELIEAETHPLPSLANVSALIFTELPNLNWAGFYLMSGGELLLGPFQGKVACIRIPVGRGVCGSAVSENRTMLVPNVHEFPGHIACDGASNSEIVVPIHNNGVVIGVLDIDSPVLSRFTNEERELFEGIAKLLEEKVDWSKWSV